MGWCTAGCPYTRGWSNHSAMREESKMLKPIWTCASLYSVIVNEVTVNGSVYKFALTNQLISQVDSLKGLYASAYEDPEGFEEVSSRISDVISEIAESIEPQATGDDLDGVVQMIIKTVDNLKAGVNRQTSKKRR